MLRPCFFWKSHTYQVCNFLLGVLQLVYLHCSFWPSLLIQHSRPTLAFKPLIPFPPILYLLPHHHLWPLAVSLHLLHPLLPLTSSGFFNKLLAVSVSGVLNRYTFFCLILLTLFVSRNLTLSFSFRIPEFSGLRFDRTHSQSGIFSSLSHTLGAASLFLS